MLNKELHKMAPTLSKIERKDAFVVPENYFESLPAQLEYLLLLKKQDSFASPEAYFDKLPQQLQQLVLAEKQETIFDVPEGYFDALPRLIQQKAQEKNKAFAWELLFRPTVKWSLAFATAVVFAFVFFNNFYVSKNVAPPQMAQLTQNELTVAVENTELQAMDEEDLYDEINSETPATDDKRTEMVDFLIENDVDINTLTNEL